MRCHHRFSERIEHLTLGPACYPSDKLVYHHKGCEYILIHPRTKTSTS